MQAMNLADGGDSGSYRGIGGRDVQLITRSIRSLSTEWSAGLTTAL
jgi:hypothetical protein